MENKEFAEIMKLAEHLLEYNQRVGQIFELTFDAIRAEGKDPFVIEDDELLEYIKKRYKGVIDE